MSVNMDDLPPEQIAVLQKAFNCFDSGKTGSISVDTVADILRLMGQPFNKQILDELIEEVDEDKSGRLEFEEFVQLAAKFIVEEDEEAMAKELREAFRLYDKEGNGFIPTTCLKEILRELDDQLSDEDLDNMIQEIDSDGSGTVDFDAQFHKQQQYQRLQLSSVSSKVSGNIIFDRITIKENLAYIHTNVSIDNNATHSFLNLDTYTYVDSTPKITIKIEAFIIPKLKKLKIFTSPKIFFCDLLTNGKMIPFFDMLMQAVARFGTLPLACPFGAGHYYMRGLTLFIPYPGQKNVSYMAAFVSTDEEKKPPAFVVKFEVYFQFR